MSTEEAPMQGTAGQVGEGAAERVRLFVALDLPEPARQALVRWRSGVLREIGQLRPVAREALHVTLCFLGSRPATDVQAIAAGLRTTVRTAAVHELEFQTGIWLPPRQPRVLAVALHDPAGTLGRLQGAASDVLCRGGWYLPEKRPFLPHVTVARVPARVRVSAIELPELPAVRFTAPAVTLYRSRLQRSGARYEPLVSIALSYEGRAA